DLAALQRLGPDLDRANPSRLGDARWRDAFVPDVLRHRRHGEIVRTYDEFRFFLAERGREVPALIVGPLLGGRHVFGVALRRTGVDTTDDALDLIRSAG